MSMGLKSLTTTDVKNPAWDMFSFSLSKCEPTADKVLQCAFFLTDPLPCHLDGPKVQELNNVWKFESFAETHVCPATSCSLRVFNEQSKLGQKGLWINGVCFSSAQQMWHMGAKALVAFSFLVLLLGGVSKRRRTSCSFSLFCGSFWKFQKEHQIWGQVKEKEKLAKLLLFHADSLTLVKVDNQHKTAANFCFFKSIRSTS